VLTQYCDFVFKLVCRGIEYIPVPNGLTSTDIYTHPDKFAMLHVHARKVFPGTWMASCRTDSLTGG
jgi:hypothetical protein